MTDSPTFQSPELDDIAERAIEFLRLVGPRGHTVKRIAEECHADAKTTRIVLGGASAKYGDCFARSGAVGKEMLWRVNERLLECRAENEALRQRVAELEAR